MNGTPETQRNGRHHAAPASLAKASRPMTPTMALIWRQWRETRWFLVGAVAFNVASAMALAAIQRSSTPIFALDLPLMVYICLAVGAAVAAVPLLITQTGAGGLTSALPSQWCTLPIRTVTLAASLLGYRVGALAAVLLSGPLAFWLVSLTGDATGLAWLRETVTGSRAWLYVALCLTLFVYVQAVEWSLRRISPWLAWPALVGGPLSVFVWWLNPDIAFGPLSLRVAVPVIPVATAVAIAGVAAQRHGAWEGMAKRFPARAGTSRTERPFYSADEALQWYEWRRAGRRLVPALWAASLFSFAVFATTRFDVQNPKLDELRKYVDLNIGPFTFVALVFGLFLPLLFSRDARTGQTAVVFTKPIRTERHVAAFFRASALTIVRGLYVPVLLLFAVAAWLTMRLPAESLPVLARNLAFSDFPILITSLAVCVWLGYLGGLLYGTALVALIAVYVVAGMSGAANVFQSDAWEVGVSLVVTVSAAAVFTRYALVYAHVTPGGFARGIAVAAFAAIVAVFTTIQTGAALGSGVLVTTAVIVPVAFWPAYLAWLRTR